ncbi:acetyl-CoA synthetase-like protein [Westerdykella ornata]|uniref:Acetyl-CoA synthetase-like protein n=1 Tax=Westerdykella ornata TaxID=318751 RepID=A0A6A6JWD8_WESOR|nr:acetyl-CoA synthetase-like protein [Westerdykella ornata]KAF2280128.1 acetyl-CoA synthetase-like protein [Westerdykella ornata]
MRSSDLPAFRRPRFDPLGKELTSDGGHDNIGCLPDLINFNAETNPNHIFCFQAKAPDTRNSVEDSDERYDADVVTFRQLKHAVDACAAWCDERIPQGPRDSKPAPVALYLESDVGLFIYLAALLSSNIPTVLLSARLSSESVRHLLKETGAQSIFLSKRTEPFIRGEVADLVDTYVVERYSRFIRSKVVDESEDGVRSSSRMKVDQNDTGVLILHSSGTTGLPKPIRLTHRYPLGYAACHKFPPEEPINWRNLSTLPLYHGFGLLAPCLSLSVGMSCVFPPSSVIPAAHSTMGLVSTFDVESLMTVPSILEDIATMPQAEKERAFSLLRGMHFVAAGGGPLNPNIGSLLVENGVNLLNHYGATEIGAIAPIFKPGPDYDWRYLRLRTDLGLELHPVDSKESPERYKLVGYPFGWGRSFEIQDEILLRPDSTHLDVKILGRRDDVIVLKNGEKVLPRNLEETLSQDPAIKTAACVGQGYFETAVIVEPSSEPLEDADAFIDHVWQRIQEVNPSLDHHARISSKRAIIIKPADKRIPRSDKGSVMRKELHLVFKEEIEAAYAALERENLNAEPLDADNLEDSIKSMIEKVMHEKLARVDRWRSSDDLFELGMDSLQATRLARLLSSSIELQFPEKLRGDRLTPSFIYQHPSLISLVGAVRKLIEGGHGSSPKRDRGAEMRALAEEYITRLHNDIRSANGASFHANGYPSGAVVLLTGSTGNLGAHTLEALVRNGNVERIICLSRASHGEDLKVRQERANSMAGIALDSQAWSKIELLAADTQAPNFGLSNDQLRRLEQNVTHIIHLAWPMDFQRQLFSFRPQLDALESLIRIARSAHRLRPQLKPRIMMASSISVVRYFRDGLAPVPEKRLDDPEVTTAMGYAEAKWVCEQVLSHVGEEFSDECTPMIVRIGQLSGPEHRKGLWKVEEHIPALIKASQMVSAFPLLTGKMSWLPMDRAAKSLVDILFSESPSGSFTCNLENPVRQPMSDLGAFVVHELKLADKMIAFDAWLGRVSNTGYAASLLDFFRNDFQALANGDVILDTTVARSVSTHLRASGAISKDLIVEYIRRWREIGHLS